MSPKRLNRVAPPPLDDEWQVRFGTTEAAKGWDGLCTHATAKVREAFEMMRSNPRPPQDETHYQLRGALATRSVNDRVLEQWQVKVSSSARIWYLPDDTTHTVWVIEASVAHPKETEPRSGRR